MAIYRNDQARFSFASEAGHGGYIDLITSATDAGGASTTLTGTHAAGSRSITVASNSGYATNDYVQIGTGANAEIRRVAAISGTTIIYLDYPLGFAHLGGETVDEKIVNASNFVSGNCFQTFLPGVYESITVPDMNAEILPFYFLGTNAARDWSVSYRGRQSFTGSLPNFILLNGFPLRFPIGKVATTGSSPANATTLSTATLKGDRTATLTSATGYVAGDYCQIDTGDNAEVRQIISVATNTLTLNYPLMIAHASGATVNEVVAPFTHTIIETTDLDSTTWNLAIQDTDATSLDTQYVTANTFLRRYMGGMIGQATISAEEGGLLRMSWDNTIFLDLTHNQGAHPSVSNIPKYSAALVPPAGIGGDMPHSGGTLGTPTYPTTSPYYFSQGTISLFGVTFARIRNFRIEINNNIEPRYYIQNNSPDRTPFEIIEQRREYRMMALIGHPDSAPANASARTLFKELLLEGEYPVGTRTGFDISLTFTRGTNDSITITIPPTAASSGLNTQGAFIVRSPHNVTPDSPIQAEVEIMFRAMKIVVNDSIAVYP